MLYEAIINNELRGRVGLRRLYPYSIEKKLTRGKYRLGGYADPIAGNIVLTDDLDGERQVTTVYLHEAAHLIAAAAGIDNDPEGRTHNQYFACLVAVIYRRAGLTDNLKIYDFGDTHERQSFFGCTEELPPDSELIKRFAYIMRRSAQLAPLPLSIEKIAETIYHEDVYPAWTNPKPKRTSQRFSAHDLITWVLGIAVGSIATAALAAVAITR